LLYRKLPVPVAIEPVTEAGTIETLEGSQEVSPDNPLTAYIVTGVKGERYAIPQTVFETYQPVEGRLGFFAKSSNVIVDAIQVDFEVTINRPVSPAIS
jgi:hypothetical protein